MQSNVLETMPQHLLGGLSGISFSPERNSEPVAQFRILMLPVQPQAYPPDQASIRSHSNPKMHFILSPDTGYKFVGIVLRVGMWNSQSRCRYLARADQRE